MKKRIIFFLIISQQFFGLYSQSDFRNGYIIDNNNDTITGLIDFKGNKSSAKICIYKKDSQSAKQTFTPDEIRAYRFIDGKYYISKSLDTSSRDLLFLEYLIDGVVDIYYYRDATGEHYFVDNGDDQLHELIKEEREVYVNDKRYVLESKVYVETLKSVFGDSLAVSKKIENVQLNHKSLIGITHEYHNEVCSDEECIIYEQKPQKKPARFGLIAGLNYTMISNVDDVPVDFYYFRNSTFERVIYPSIGLYLKFNIPSVNERLLLQYEGTYSHVSYSAASTYIEPTNGMSLISDIQYTENVFSNVLAFRYEYPKRKIQPTMQIGMFLNYSFMTEYYRHLDVNYSWGGTYFSREYEDNPFNSYDLGLSVGLGVKKEFSNKKEVLLELKYQKGFAKIAFLDFSYLLLNVSIQLL